MFVVLAQEGQLDWVLNEKVFFFVPYRTVSANRDTLRTNWNPRHWYIRYTLRVQSVQCPGLLRFLGPAAWGLWKSTGLWHTLPVHLCATNSANDTQPPAPLLPTATVLLSTRSSAPPLSLFLYALHLLLPRSPSFLSPLYSTPNPALEVGAAASMFSTAADLKDMDGCVCVCEILIILHVFTELNYAEVTFWCVCVKAESPWEH